MTMSIVHVEIEDFMAKTPKRRGISKHGMVDPVLLSITVLPMYKRTRIISQNIQSLN